MREVVGAVDPDSRRFGIVEDGTVDSSVTRGRHDEPESRRLAGSVGPPLDRVQHRPERLHLLTDSSRDHRHDCATLG